VSINDLWAASAESSSGVRHTAELDRILALPERDPEALGARLVKGLTRRLRSRDGTMVLKPIQALALAEAHDLGGLLGPLPVGSGKTLLAMLLPVVVPCKRPVLLVPAKHTDRVKPERGKTQIEFAELRKAGWDYNSDLTIVSYELVSRRPDLLAELAPDLLIADEAHRLKNPKAAVTKRVRKYGQQAARSGHPLKFVALSGTLTARSYLDYWHLQQWALPGGLSTLPRKYEELRQWCEAMDSKVEYRRPLGALSVFGHGLKGARKGYGERLRLTPGVVTQETQDCAASIQVTVRELEHPQIKKVSETMRRTWETPAGDPFSEAPRHWAHQCEVGNGFWYEWTEKPPARWMAARKEFHAWVRSVLANSRTHDSMLQVTKAHPKHPALLAWRAVKDTFKPVTVAKWFTHDILDRSNEWLCENDRGLVWVNHKEVGFELARLSGLPYFGAQGRTSDGRSIMDYEGPAIVSARAVGDGFNLQYNWDKNLILNCDPNGKTWEQVMGRTHRQGQAADEVTYEVVCTTIEQTAGVRQAMADAERSHDLLHPQKLCLADVDFVCNKF
jgi:hypothetical protein